MAEHDRPISPTESIGSYSTERCLSPVKEFYPVINVPETAPRTVGPIWIPIQTLNPYITCGLCKGYLYEATTITECMHTFCKSCFVKHTERSVHCPICSLLIHPTDPFVNVKLDRTLQDIVYRLLPHVAEDEHTREEKFNKEFKFEPKVIAPKQKSKEKVKEKKTSAEDSRPFTPVSIILESRECIDGISAKPLSKKYVRVTGGATIGTVATFLKKKLSVEDRVNVDLYCALGTSSVCLDGTHTLQAVKDLYCQQQEFLQLQYHFRPL